MTRGGRDGLGEFRANGGKASEVTKCLHRSVRAGLAASAKVPGSRVEKGELGDPAGGCLGGVTGSGLPRHLQVHVGSCRDHLAFRGLS
jgi:hypothetical protein